MIVSCSKSAMCQIVVARVGRVFMLAALLSLFVVTPVLALSLEEAKSAGLVGELQNGYLSTVNGDVRKEVLDLVTSINAKRKEKYKAIAGKRGISVEAVEKLAGKTAISRSAAGELVQASDGSWVKK